jgi:low affinity Fe/Cu permease
MCLKIDESLMSRSQTNHSFITLTTRKAEYASIEFNRMEKADKTKTYVKWVFYTTSRRNM